MSPGRTVGRTLARLGTLAPRREPTGSDTRKQILAWIQGSAAPVGVEDICAATGLHANTVRGHLEVLLAAGAIHREPGERRGRGRPRLLYRAGPGSALYEELTRSLAEQLGAPDQTELVEQAAQRWADAVDPGVVVDTPDAAVAQAADVLRELGFTADISPVGDEITLGACPFLDLVAQHPILCDIHTALLDEVLHRSGQPVSVREMDVFPTPGICVARLRRADRRPLRTIRTETTPEDPRRAEQDAELALRTGASSQ